MAVRDTLLLNQGYQPLKVIPWRRALCMTFLGKVEVVSDHLWEVATVSRAYPVPAVVRLLKHVRGVPTHVRFSRENVYLRDQHLCQYCGRRFRPRELTLDHVVPRAHGGRTTWRNVVAACVPCNRRKGGRTPEQAGLVLRNYPRRPRWFSPAQHLGLREVPEAWRAWIH